MYSILLLPGDGIGPEVMTETRRVVGWFSQNRNFGCTFEEDLVGGISYETHGVPGTDAMIAKAKAADAVLFGAVGGPNGIRCRSTGSRSRACSSCAKSSSCSPICAPRFASMR
jgi:isocitrate/isopropylmalate dehydrogenase